jgi:energy-coupling factor transporter transmembrane protein EcfT
MRWLSLWIERIFFFMEELIDRPTLMWFISTVVLFVFFMAKEPKLELWALLLVSGFLGIFGVFALMFAMMGVTVVLGIVAFFLPIVDDPWLERKKAEKQKRMAAQKEYFMQKVEEMKSSKPKAGGFASGLLAGLFLGWLLWDGDEE